MSAAVMMEPEFWARVSKGPECWTWTGPRCTRGDALGSYEGVRERAHRIAWRLTRGDLSDEMKIRRTCRNSLCVNPEHLRQSGIDDEQADQLRVEYESGAITQQQIADRIGIDRATVTRAIARSRERHFARCRRVG